MESLDDLFQCSMSIHALEEEKKMLEDQAESIRRRIQTTHEKLNKKRPTLMDIQDRKRKIDCIDNQELELLVSMMENDMAEESSTDDDEDDIAKT